MRTTGCLTKPFLLTVHLELEVEQVVATYTPPDTPSPGVTRGSLGRSWAARPALARLDRVLCAPDDVQLEAACMKLLVAGLACRLRCMLQPGEVRCHWPPVLRLSRWDLRNHECLQWLCRLWHLLLSAVFSWHIQRQWNHILHFMPCRSVQQRKWTACLLRLPQRDLR